MFNGECAPVVARKDTLSYRAVKFVKRNKIGVTAAALVIFTLLSGIVASDFRYVPKDRTAYMAYMRMKRETAGLGMWQAQQAYFDWIQRNDPLALP